MASDNQYTEQQLANRAYDPVATVLVASGARTTSSNSTVLDVGPFDEVVVFLNVTAASGTTPTLDLKVQLSPDQTNFYDPGATFAFTQQTATGGQVLRLTNFGRYIRLSWAIGGTTPSFTFDATVVGKTLGT